MGEKNRAETVGWLIVPGVLAICMIFGSLTMIYDYSATSFGVGVEKSRAEGKRKECESRLIGA